MTPLQSRIGKLEAPPETKPTSRANRWIVAMGYSLARLLVTGLYVFAVGIQVIAVGVSHDLRSFGVLALTVAYAILMLLLWLYQRFPSAR